MAQEILNNVLNAKILPEEIIEWLTANNQQNVNWININQNLPKAEFVAYFLNFLRDQFAIAQPAATNIKQTPSKEKASKPPTTNTVNKESLKIDNSGIVLNNANRLNDSVENLEKRSTLNVSTNNTNHNVLTKGVLIIKSPENRKQIFESNKSCENLLESDDKIPISQSNQTNKKRVLLQNVTEKSDCTDSNLIVSKNIDSQQQKASNLSILSDFNQSFSKSPNIRNVELNVNKLFSPGNDSFVNLSKDQCSSLNASLVSQNYTQYECSSNSSQTSENSSKSELHLLHSPITFHDTKNPVSPLYSQTKMLTPKNTAHKSQKKSTEKQWKTNNYFKHSTPEQNSNSSQKGVKSSSRQNISLADFITVDTRSSRKSSGKKNNQKQLSRHSRDDETPVSTSALSEENFPEFAQSFERRRRIKPTKLDITSEKGDKENTVFGIVKRPAAANPQFSEVQSSDQTSDKASFEMERVLLRLERQKKPETSIENKTDLDSCNKAVRPPRMPTLSKSIIVPSLAMVDETEILVILAQIYCAFIDNNLILNPMTEMYFILSLITAQYHRQKTLRKSKESSETKESPETSDNSKLRRDLEIDLGCAVLNEVDDLSQSEDKMLFSNKDVEQFNELTMNEKTVINSEILRKNDDISKKMLKIDDLHLGTPHNCVFFSTHVLNQERHWLQFLDRTTLKLLSENSHIAEFQPELQIYLQTLYDTKLSEMNRTKQHTFSVVDPNVSFQIDTDNRENFPTAVAFQSFRKQRDLFYDVLKVWEENHTNSNWKFSVALSPKIKMMLTLHSDVTNHCHIARLFKSQLLISCIHSGQQEDVIDEESLSILKSLKGVNPEKLTQLKERLVTPLSSTGPVPEPNFPGIQEFYKNFILYSFNPMFYAHLEDCLIHEILELNDMQFAASEIGDSETTVDERTKQNFIICLSSLRLLAKFLGFLVSLPYRSSTSSFDEVVKSQVSLRSRLVPVLNLQACLQEAVIHGKLSLTIPWIVEYLSQLDTASLRLPYYKNSLEILYCIYRISKLDVAVVTEQIMSHQTLILINFSLGWLFELPNFPTDFYFSWQSSHSDKKLTTFCRVENEKMEIAVANKNNTTVDKLDIIDERVLYSCCPFLIEFKILLAGNSQSTNNKTNRHITPVSSQLANATDSTSAKNLELQLEEAFFYGQPASTRKTIEFVSERVASTCVKYIFNSLLPAAQENCLNQLRQNVVEKYRKTLEENPDILKSLMLKRTNNLAANIAKEVKEQIDKEIPSMCKTRISQSIDSLLAVDTLLTVKETCTQITIRMTKDRIAQWIQSHIGGLLFMRDMEVKIGQVAKNDNPTICENEDKHNLDAACPTDVLDDLRACSWEFLDNRGKSVTVEFISKILDQLYTSCTERGDLIHGPENCLRTMSVDLFLFLVTYRRELLTTDIEMKFVKYWKLVLTKIPESNFSLSRILSPRNVIILEKSNSNDVWSKCGQFIKLLLKEKILSLECLSDQSVALLRQEWPTETLQNLSKCLIIGIEDYRTSDESAERIRYLIRWIAETYKDIDDLDH